MMNLPSIKIGKEVLSIFENAVGKEWLITNGLGGYASSTALAINTRKYHGLLVAAFNPPRDRRVCIEKFDEELKIGNVFYPIFANEFQNGVYPKGHEFLKEFSLSPFPKYYYGVQNVDLSKTVFMPRGVNAVIVAYEVLNKNGVDIELQIHPNVTCRHFHSVVDRWRNPPKIIQTKKDRKVIVNVESPESTLIIESTEGSYVPAEKWLEKVYYREEHSRGESYLDDWRQLGYFTVKIKAKTHEKFALFAVAAKNMEQAEKIASTMPATFYDVENLYARELTHRERLLTKFYDEHKTVRVQDWLGWLVLASDMFVVGFEKAQRSVIAGYHWFEDWGRDAFVSLPGLMLVTGKFEDARQTFLTFNKHVVDGLIPNFISDKDAQPVYNSVDATLWYVNAVLQYLKYTGDFTFIKLNLWENLKVTAENLIRGINTNIRVDSDGLLLHGPQVTWMDTVVDGHPVTPRAGKAVEVQALWYNAVKTLELLARRFKEPNVTEKFVQLAEKARESFVKKFWNIEKNCLFDAVNEWGCGDPSVRPNQIIAVSLDFTMLDSFKNSKVVDVVRRELLTPFGLRTLARNEPKYVGVYSGDRRSRDLAYHNGTAWPWLLGPFTTAYLKTEGYGEYMREYAFKNFLLPLFTEQVLRAGLGTINEIFDGDPPHNPRGCIAQAWSVAEPLRAYVEDVAYCRPKYEREIRQTLR